MRELREGFPSVWNRAADLRSSWRGRHGWRRAAVPRVLHNPLVQAAGVGLAGYGVYRLLQRIREESLAGQVVLITGGSRGLGLLLAREFAREGCKLALCARDEYALARAQRDLLNRGARDVFTAICDVTDRHEVRNVINKVTRHYGRIDILVNNAGIIQVGPLDTLTERDFERALDVMFWGVLYPTMAVLPQMRERRCGRIVNITSIGGMVSVPHLLAYNCAKFAAVGLSQGLHAELGREGIRVSTIVPGTMRVGSHLNAHFRGQAKSEYEWFAIGASVPLLSVDGNRAARQIVKVAKRGQAFKVIGLPAQIVERLNGLFPGTMANVMSLVNRFLPQVAASRGIDDQVGHAAAQKVHSSLFQVLTRRGYFAAEQTNQFSDGDPLE